MPSLNTKRQVRYTQADLNAIKSALTVLEFMAEFDDSYSMSAEPYNLLAIAAHIRKRRAEAGAKSEKPNKGPAAGEVIEDPNAQVGLAQAKMP